MGDSAVNRSLGKDYKEFFFLKKTFLAHSVHGNIHSFIFMRGKKCSLGPSVFRKHGYALHHREINLDSNALKKLSSACRDFTHIHMYMYTNQVL